MTLRMTITGAVLLFAGLLGAGCGTKATGCTDNSSCTPAAPVCDTSTGSCETCTPTDTAFPCPSGTHCVSIKASPSSPAHYACRNTCTTASDCAAGSGGKMACCGGLCVDTTKDASNCGACGVACASAANTTSTCLAGTCNIECAPGFTDCDNKMTNGCETKTSTDISNCGTCGKKCPSGDRGAALCTAGACSLACNPGYADCDADATNGCEVNSAADVSNCGSCANICPAPANATAACKGGNCAIGTCRGGYADCNADATDGCEANLNADKANCGTCGTICGNVANGNAGCVNGSCGIATCNANFANCSGKVADGCNVQIDRDVRNCGACGTICSGPHSSQTCTASKCAITQCQDGFNDCNTDPKDGCEALTTQDVNNCGMCKNACPALPHSSVTCKASVCTPGACDNGWAHCSQNPADGCEVDITTVLNCGKCGNACNVPNASPACKGGGCTVDMCNQGYANCNNDPVDGCESKQDSDPQNCGKCGTVCPNVADNLHSLPGCKASACGVGACKPGWTDCNNDPKDGCEAATGVDAKNCGGCGVVCGGKTPDCISGKCGVSIHMTTAWNPNGRQSFDCGWINAICLFEYYSPGNLNWKDCLREASRQGAMAMGPSSGDWDFTGQYIWFGLRNGANAMSILWDGVSMQSIGSNLYCVLLRDPQTLNTDHKGFLESAISYDGQDWIYQDYGKQYYADCQKLAGQAGASIITPWTLGLGNGDDYYIGMYDICGGAGWSASKGTDFSTDGDIGQGQKHLCMVGYPAN